MWRDALSIDPNPRTIVVADATLTDRLRQAGLSDASMVTVDHYLAALGEMSAGGVRAVVGRLDPMAESMDTTVAALRELAPDAKLLLVIDAEQEPDAMRAVRLGFDDYFVEPVACDRLVELLSSNGQMPTVPEPSKHHESTATEPSSQPAMNLARKLGDIDLVEQLLRDRRGLREMAVQLIAQRVGHNDIHWLDDDDATYTTRVPIHYADQSMGYLASNTESADTLAAYANWLSRWATLERHLTRLNDLAMRDEMTGVWNRRYFDRFMASIVQRAHDERFRVTLMLYDIDDFKDYNDKYGHLAGDEILIETAKLMTSVVRKHDIVARVGGDEFAVIFWDAEAPRRKLSEHPHSVRTAAERFQRAICEHRFPKLAEEVHGTLTISGGLASYPWDGQTAEQLYDLADQMLLESKNQGKNALTFGAGAMRACGLTGEEDDEQ